MVNFLFTCFIRRFKDIDRSGGRHLWVPIQCQIPSLITGWITEWFLANTPAEDGVALDVDFISVRVFEHLVYDGLGFRGTVERELGHHLFSWGTPGLVDELNLFCVVTEWKTVLKAKGCYAWFEKFRI